MCDFQPGDEIEKVRDTDAAWLDTFSLPRGTRATVAAIVPCPWFRCDGVRLVEYPDNGAGHAIENWRKVQRRDLSAWLETAVDVPALDKSRPAPAKKRERV